VKMQRRNSFTDLAKPPQEAFDTLDLSWSSKSPNIQSRN